MKSLRKHEDFRWKLINHKNTNRSFLRDPIKPFRECCSRVLLTSGILYYESDNSRDATYYARKVHGLISGCKIHTGRWMADIKKHCQRHNGPRILSPKLELSLKAETKANSNSALLAFLHSLVTTFPTPLVTSEPTLGSTTM